MRIPNTRSGLTLLQAAFATLSLALLLTASTHAQSGRDQVRGVHNFGKVTDRYFRGGLITAEGIDNLQKMGVRTVIDLRDEDSPGEAEACKWNGIRYFKFPMNGQDTPDTATVDEILKLVQDAKEPVYVHCSGGKHRAGTIAALYRMRVQGWSKESAWAEQRSYGFGLAEEHHNLYTYAYHRKHTRSDGETLPLASTVALAVQPIQSDDGRSYEADSDNDNGRAIGRERDDDSDKDKDKIKDKDREKERKAAKSRRKKEEKELKASKKKYDDDEDEADDDDADGNADRTRRTEVVLNEKRAADESSREVTRTEEKTATTSTIAKEKADAETATASAKTVSSLDSNGDYMELGDAIIRARTEGGTGDVLKVDLEWDPARTLVTWDVTFSSGEEFELDANSGKLLGRKSKVGPKLGILVPLALEGSAKMKMLSFQDIIQIAESARNMKVLEMELKRIKGRSETVFEVALTDGSTLYFDAASGLLVPGV
ncbi:MAG: tyrosine-protein phosphatase [Acidobacteriota bacterium]